MVVFSIQSGGVFYPNVFSCILVYSECIPRRRPGYAQDTSEYIRAKCIPCTYTPHVFCKCILLWDTLGRHQNTLRIHVFKNSCEIHSKYVQNTSEYMKKAVYPVRLSVCLPLTEDVAYLRDAFVARGGRPLDELEPSSPCTVVLRFLGGCCTGTGSPAPSSLPSPSASPSPSS